MVTKYRLACLMLVTLAGPTVGHGQRPSSLDSLVGRLAAMTAVSGYEQAMVDTLLRLLPGATRDRAGNVVLVLGQGEPKTLIACPLDEPGFVVGGIRPDGYLTLRRAGPSPGPLADQQYEGQRVTVFGRKGAVPGVIAVRSVHLTRGRSVSDAPFTFDDAYLDVGADSAAQIARLGIEVLSPVARAKAPHRYGDMLLAAPVAGRRAACAALLRAARLERPPRGTVVIAFVVEQSFTRRGLRTVAHTHGPFADAILLDGTPDSVRSVRPASPEPALMPSFELWRLRVRYAGTPVETVSLRETTTLERGLSFRIRGGE